MANAPPMPGRRRAVYAALLLTGLAALGWLVFAFGSAGLVLRSGACAGGTAMDLVLLGWLLVVVGAGAVPPALLFVGGRWSPALRALGIGAAAAVVFYALAFAGVSAGCG